MWEYEWFFWVERRVKFPAGFLEDLYLLNYAWMNEWMNEYLPWYESRDRVIQGTHSKTERGEVAGDEESEIHSSLVWGHQSYSQKWIFTSSVWLLSPLRVGVWKSNLEKRAPFLLGDLGQVSKLPFVSVA